MVSNTAQCSNHLSSKILGFTTEVCLFECIITAGFCSEITFKRADKYFRGHYCSHAYFPFVLVPKTLNILIEWIISFFKKNLSYLIKWIISKLPCLGFLPCSCPFGWQEMASGRPNWPILSCCRALRNELELRHSPTLYTVPSPLRNNPPVFF